MPLASEIPRGQRTNRKVKVAKHGNQDFWDPKSENLEILNFCFQIFVVVRGFLVQLWIRPILSYPDLVKNQNFKFFILKILNFQIWESWFSAIPDVWVSEREIWCSRKLPICVRWFYSVIWTWIHTISPSNTNGQASFTILKRVGKVAKHGNQEFWESEIWKSWILNFCFQIFVVVRGLLVQLWIRPILSYPDRVKNQNFKIFILKILIFQIWESWTSRFENFQHFSCFLEDREVPAF